MGVILRERKRAKGKTTLYLDIYQGGQRRVVNTGIHLTGDKKADKQRREYAEVMRTQKEMEQHGFRIGMTPAHKRKTDLLVYLDAQAQRKHQQGYTHQQTNPYRSTVKMIKEYAAGPIEIAGITPEWLEGFKDYLRGRVKQNTAANYYGLLRTILNKAVKEGIIQSSPCKRVDLIKKVETERSHLTSEEVQFLADTPCDYPQLKSAFLFACCTGARISDIEQMTWKQIVGNQYEFRMQKTGALLYLPLNSSAINLLGARGADVDHVFKLPGRRVIGYQLEKWSKTAGITKPVSFHTSRHSFATISLTAGVELAVISKNLGHKNIATTQVYAKVVDSKRRDAVNMIPEIRLTMVL